MVLADAVRSTKASMPAVMAVRALMADGAPRIDQEIQAAVTVVASRGKRPSLSLVQHARKALSDSGFLALHGQPKETLDGQPSRAWVWRGDAAEFDAIVSDVEWCAHVRSVRRPSWSKSAIAQPSVRVVPSPSRLVSLGDVERDRLRGWLTDIEARSWSGLADLQGWLYERLRDH